MNNTIRKKAWICAAIALVILVVDQWLKIWVKTHMMLADDIPLIGDWCRLHFIENIGFAFGTSFGGGLGKLVLTLIRLFASAFLLWFLVSQMRKNASWLLLLSLTLIIVGAVGNLIDSCFYGLIFSESDYNKLAVLFPPEGGYTGFMKGKVVDMWYFPLFTATWPQWMPFVGGNTFEFFNAIFNVADAAVTVGVVLLIIDQFFIKKETPGEAKEADGEAIEANAPQTAPAAPQNGANGGATTAAEAPSEPVA